MIFPRSQPNNPILALEQFPCYLATLPLDVNYMKDVTDLLSIDF